MRRGHIFFVCGIFVLISVFGGCGRKAPQTESQAPLAVRVSQPIQRDVVDFVDYTGRTDAVNSVNIQARVTGYLVKMPFKEGAEVTKDDLLFEIDPRPYQAQLDQAQAQVKLYEAQLKLATANYARAKELAKTPGAISQQDLDAYQAQEDEASAALTAAKASLEVYNLNLEFTRVTSPIDGQVSRYYLTLGNLVNQDQTQLTTVVSLDPMYVYFDMDEPTVLKIRRLIGEGKIPRHTQGNFKVYMSLQGEKGFPHEGILNFVNNQVNPATGSILIRGEFPNPKMDQGVRLLSPGMFARIHLPIGGPHPAFLVFDSVIVSDQGQKYLYIVTPDNTIEKRHITTGALQEDGCRVILDGIKADEQVVTSNLQQLRPQMKVKTDLQPMPKIGPENGNSTATETEKKSETQGGEGSGK